MKFSLPAQLKGPECKDVIVQAIALRKVLEPIFADIEIDSVSEIVVILRIDGSLGSFGPEAIENFKLSKGVLECDVVIRNYGWGSLKDAQIFEIIKLKVHEAIVSCFNYLDFNADMGKLNGAFK